MAAERAGRSRPDLRPLAAGAATSPPRRLCAAAARPAALQVMLAAGRATARRAARRFPAAAKLRGRGRSTAPDRACWRRAPLRARIPAPAVNSQPRGDDCHCDPRRASELAPRRARRSGAIARRSRRRADAPPSGGEVGQDVRGKARRARPFRSVRSTAAMMGSPVSTSSSEQSASTSSSHKAVEFGALTHDSFRLAATQVEADKSAEVARQGEEPGPLPIEHPSGPESTELPVHRAGQKARGAHHGRRSDGAPESVLAGARSPSTWPCRRAAAPGCRGTARSSQGWVPCHATRKPRSGCRSAPPGNPAHGPVAGRVDLAERVGQQVAVALAESCLVDLGRVPEIVPRAMARAQHDQGKIAALTSEQPGGDVPDLIGALRSTCARSSRRLVLVCGP